MGPTSMPVYDGTGNRHDMAQEEGASGLRTPRFAPEVAGKAVGGDNPMPVSIPDGIPTTPAGSTGYDYSANGLTTPPGVLLATVPANDSRLHVEVQNQSAADITLVRDDGANGQRSVIVLATGGAVGAQGGGWASSTFRGRVRVYGPTGSRISVMED